MVSNRRSWCVGVFWMHRTDNSVDSCNLQSSRVDVQMCKTSAAGAACHRKLPDRKSVMWLLV